ncbi:hypothetical protein [Acetomicrobium sp.]|uniref:hypothetical protein n=1 Tax=Acetomicrobium sp. TaxID=1872099 RepID=UPI002FC8B1C4
MRKAEKGKAREGTFRGEREGNEETSSKYPPEEAQRGVLSGPQNIDIHQGG